MEVTEKQLERVTNNMMPLGKALVGPASWRNNTMKGMKLSENIVKKSDKACKMGRMSDPQTQVKKRDFVAELSNEEVHKYFRQTRTVVCLLRESIIDTNEEIKSLTRTKESLEKALEHLRKDIKLNQESQNIRLSRPKREREHDGADSLLQAEYMHLLNLKRRLESQLQLVQQQLQVLDQARSRLLANNQERSRVLDLVCHSIPSTRVSMSCSPNHRGGSRYRGSRLSMSADPDRASRLTIDPLGPYTPETDQALQDASDARARSNMLRRNAGTTMDNLSRVQQSAHKSVNDGLTQKIGETVSLKQQLDLSAGANRHSTHRATRWYDATERAWNNTRGPVTSCDLTTRERLERPVIRVFQRHPGTNLPEADEIVRGGDGLLQSLQATSQNIGLLNLAQLKLKEDIMDKKRAIDVDSAIVRLRRRKANHRWAMGAAF